MQARSRHPRSRSTDQFGDIPPRSQTFWSGSDVISIQNFLENYHTWIEIIRTDLEAYDSGKLEKSAHRLASALSCLYAMKVFGAAGELERAARAGDWPRSHKLYHALSESMPRLVEELQ